MSKAKQVQISQIRADAAAQPREHMLTDIVAAYTDDMTAGAEFPPLVVFQEGEVFWLADGFHRLSAARGITKRIDCEVHRGGLREAILYSCGANAEHGYRRTNEDKRRAVSKLLHDEEWSHWSDHEIARRAHVSHYFVGKMRDDLTSNVASENRTFKTKHGTVAHMNTAAIGAQKDPVKRAEVPPSKNDTERVRHTAEEAGWIAPMLFEIQKSVARLPQPEEAAASFPRRLRDSLDPVELARWFTAFSDAWHQFED